MYQKEIDIYWMTQALTWAHRANRNNEVPIGAVLVREDQQIAAGLNACILLHDPSAHAEMVAIRRAGLILSNYRLINTIMYVTVEPCWMCLAAVVHARVSKLVFGTPDFKSGALEQNITYRSFRYYNHTLMVKGGILQEECLELLQSFFVNKRKQKEKN